MMTEEELNALLIKHYIQFELGVLDDESREQLDKEFPKWKMLCAYHIAASLIASITSKETKIVIGKNEILDWNLIENNVVEAIKENLKFGCLDDKKENPADMMAKRLAE